MLWIMSKRRDLDSSIIDSLVEKSRQLGFAVDQMIYRRDVCKESLVDAWVNIYNLIINFF